MEYLLHTTQPNLPSQPVHLLHKQLRSLSRRDSIFLSKPFSCRDKRIYLLDMCLTGQFPLKLIQPLHMSIEFLFAPGNKNV